MEFVIVFGLVIFIALGIRARQSRQADIAAMSNDEHFVDLDPRLDNVVLPDSVGDGNA
jgi:hypothetical protein